MGERCGTGNPAGGTVSASTWDWMDSALLYHLSRESTSYAGVLLDKDGSMEWPRWKKQTQQSHSFSIFFMISNGLHDVTCVPPDHLPYFRMKLYT